MKRCLFILAALFTAVISFANPRVDKLIKAARSQIGVTTMYDPQYRRLAYPGGDPPRDRGVCTDVVIRAYRDAFDYDLQRSVHEDMKAHFSKYPKNWGMKSTDRNIDHRRVPNLQKFFDRKGAAIRVTNLPTDYKPGDIVTQMVGGRLPHILIISDKRRNGTPLVIHNIGGGTVEEDALFDHPITGHYRFIPDSER